MCNANELIGRYKMLLKSFGVNSDESLKCEKGAIVFLGRRWITTTKEPLYRSKRGKSEAKH